MLYNDLTDSTAPNKIKHTTLPTKQSNNVYHSSPPYQRPKKQVTTDSSNYYVLARDCRLHQTQDYVDA